MNPYDFVRVDWDRPPQRGPYAPHDRFAGWTGYLDCRLTAETPLFIPQQRTSSSRTAANTPTPFISNGVGQHIVPGSSLKGMLRGLVETLGPGCWRIFDGDYKDETSARTPIPLPTPFQPCRYLDHLCLACRLFGLIGRGRDPSLVGKVSIGDATSDADAIVPHEPVFTPILGGPKPRHTSWYTDTTTGRPAGRKYYFHQAELRTDNALRKTKGDRVLNAYIRPLGLNSAFTFRVRFVSLMDDELALLVYVIALEDAMRHKIGFAKPAGFGSVRITIQGVQWQRMDARYRGERQNPLEPDAVNAFVAEQSASAKTRIPMLSLTDLQRIWRWPSRGQYMYPDQDWFAANPTTPISGTP